SAPIDWLTTAHSPAPSPPVYSNANEATAAAELAVYRPGLFARLFSLEVKQRARLEAAVEEGRTLDEQAFRALQEKYKVAHEAWAWHQQLAATVLSGKPSRIRNGHQLLRTARGTRRAGMPGSVWDERALVHLRRLACQRRGHRPLGREVAPRKREPSSKKMPAAKQREIYQDYVCGSALRCAREMLAVLPVQFVLVNVSLVMLNKSTGHQEATIVLSVAFSRFGVERLNVAALDPSDAISNFVHRMGFKKSSGFSRVEPVQPQEVSAQPAGGTFSAAQ
ncbi:MAG: hypothetical protein K0R38_7436, partial [Polyangiaceae bacterium]|nr:hypothetical protein [Polyangiaceae bacterium]